MKINHQTFRHGDPCPECLKGKVYKYDEIAKVENMSAQLRLEYHLQYSKPVMEELKKWPDEQINQKSLNLGSKYPVCTED